MKLLKTNDSLNLNMDKAFVINNSFKAQLNSSETIYTDDAFLSATLENIEFQYMYIIHSIEIKYPITTNYFIEKSKATLLYMNYIYSVYNRVTLLEDKDFYHIQCSHMKSHFISLKNIILNNTMLDYWLVKLLKYREIPNFTKERVFSVYKIIPTTKIYLSKSNNGSHLLDFLTYNLDISLDGYSFMIPFYEIKDNILHELLEELTSIFENIYCLSVNNFAFAIIIRK